MDSGVEKDLKGEPVAEVTVGSVTVSIYHAPVTVKVVSPVLDGCGKPQETTKTYDSYFVAFYEGWVRVQTRRKSLALAREHAKEIAKRLNKDGARAEFISEKDRRIFMLSKRACQPLKLEVDEDCRRYAELQSRVKEGTLEQAVDFKNDFGEEVRLGATSQDILDEYLLDLEKRGVGDYHVRDVERYVGGFVRKFPGVFSRIQTPTIDDYLAGLGGKSGMPLRRMISTFRSIAGELPPIDANPA